MGCDIHLHVEQYLATQARWSCVDGVLPLSACDSCDGAGTILWKPDGTRDPCPYCRRTGVRSGVYRARNYSCFAILADVRNGYGVAGCDTGDAFRPIAMPRELPDDVSPDVREASNDEGEDGHSRTWLRLDEILAYDWNQVSEHCGFVSSIGYARWKPAGGFPAHFCGGVGGPKVQIVSNAEMDRLLAEGIASADGDDEMYLGRNGTRYYTQIAWTATYRESAGPQWWAFLDRVKTLGDPQEIRLVFWFDN